MGKNKNLKRAAQGSQNLVEMFNNKTKKVNKGSDRVRVRDSGSSAQIQSVETDVISTDEDVLVAVPTDEDVSVAVLTDESRSIAVSTDEDGSVAVLTHESRSIAASKEGPGMSESISVPRIQGKQSTERSQPADIQTPFQPRDPSIFKLRSFCNGKVSRKFKASWFDNTNWSSWLHYDEENDAAFCFTCIKATRMNLITATKNAEKAFISEGFVNWKDAATKGRGFDAHCNSESHKDAVNRLITIPATCGDISSKISSAHNEEKSTNRQCLLKILSNIRFLARQAHPMRGHGSGEDSNFTQLYLLREEDNPYLKTWRTEKKTDKYIHSTIQNEIMQIMALQILRNIASNIRESDFYSMMCDEATDVGNTTQLVICLRWVDENLTAHDEFIGLKNMPTTDAASIVRELKDVLLRMHLKLNKCRGQCYDGCSTMSGAKSGVAVQIKDEENRALYTHCYAHSLNLAVGDTMKGSEILKHTIDTTFELTKLVKKSPKRDAKLQNIQSVMGVNKHNEEGEEDEDEFDRLLKNPTIKLFCPTRWTVRAECLNGVIKNYDELQELWQWSLENCSDSVMKGRIGGVKSHTKLFSYCFGIHLAHLILGHSDNLNKTLQGTQMSAIDAQTISKATVSTLESIRKDDQFDLFWEKVKKFSNDHGIDLPKLKRKKNAPAKIFFGKAPGEHPETPADDYRRKYREALDLVINCIKGRFDQTDYQMYATCEQLLLKAVKKQEYEAELDKICLFYRDDFNQDILNVQLKTLPTVITAQDIVTFRDIRKSVQTLSTPQKALISQVTKLLRLIIVMPATNAVSERSFSAMRRLFTYLRTNMSQNRLNNTMVLHIHKEKLDDVSLIDLANDFVEGNEHRQTIFGKFDHVDLRSKNVVVKSRGTQVNVGMVDAEIQVTMGCRVDAETQT